MGVWSKRWDSLLQITFYIFPQYPFSMKVSQLYFWRDWISLDIYSRIFWIIKCRELCQFGSFAGFGSLAFWSLLFTVTQQSCLTIISLPFSFYMFISLLILKTIIKYIVNLPLIPPYLTSNIAHSSFQAISIIHQFYLILFQTSMSTLHASQLQKRFVATSMYKRSKQYFDINKLNHIETIQEKSRRRPYLQSNTESLDNKFEESFISTQTKINMRLQTEFDKHQKRFFHDQKDQTETNYTIEGQFLSNFRRKGKTLDMSKMLPRNYYEKQAQQCKDQSHFCNFKEYRIPNNHNIDFRKFFVPKIPKRKQSGQNCVKCKSKSKQPVNSKMDELNADICGKIHETLIFDESLFKTMVDYKKYNKEKTEREEQATIEKDIDRIIIGENMTRKNPKSAAAEFYHGLNKWNSAQMDNRLMKQNQYFLKLYNTKNEKQVDWCTIKRKTDLIQKRKREIMMRKNIPDIKGEICDEIYFRRNHH